MEKSLYRLEKVSDEDTVSSMMSNLSEKEQKVIFLRHQEGLSFIEIADKLKESVNTIKSRYRRGLINLKRSAGK